MSLPPSSEQPAGDEECLPPEVQQLLLEAVDEGFAMYCCGPKTAPYALVASYQWEDYLDLVTIQRFDRIITARVVLQQRSQLDVFSPEVVVWAYEGPPQCALRALLDLVHPHHIDAPTCAYPAPPGLRIPRARQRPMTIQLPPPDRVGARATRLAAAMATRVAICS